MSGLKEPYSSTDGRRMFLKASAVFMIGITFGMFLLNLAWLTGAMPNIPAVSGHSSLLRFSSYLELKTFLHNTAHSWPYYYEWFRAGQPVSVSLAQTMEDAIDYSGTNIQVEGVDEADIIKCDGEYIYLTSEGRVLIVKAYPPEDAKAVAEIKLNGTVVGIFINGDRLAVFEAEHQEFSLWRSEMIPFYPDRLTNIKIYDVEDRTNPILVRTISSDGGYFASRMIGDYVYVLVNQPAYFQEDEVPLPIIVSEGQVERVSASKVYYANVSDYYYGFTTVIAVNVQDEEVEPVHETFLLGTSRGIYMSLSNIYLAVPRYDADTGLQKTEVHRLLIEDNNITCVASGEVPGHILNQFSMDEYQGYFRIATTAGHVSRTFDQATSMNHMYVLDMNLTVVGSLENLAPSERIYSARFIGRRCYLVTFKKVDPLFVISLEDPVNPVVLGKLKIPGYSNYLHPYSENFLIGIGKETVEAEEGDFAWYQGVKISLFDVSDVELPMEIAQYVIGDRGTDSPLLSDHKALLFDRERNLLAIPVLVAEIDEEKYPNEVPPYAYGDYVWQGLYIFEITENSIALRGGVTHLDDESELMMSGYYFYSEYSVKRSLYIEDLLYSISDKKIKINDLTTLQEVKEIELP
ncbi:MAG: beta-propeller domain-containing protein [Candidatus Bathyarchaeota archaeon]|nr:beta-propeller domain-containing protein [Candidatus Bathyarchaeota archaeon]